MSTSKKPLAIGAALIVLAFVGWGLYQAFQPQRLPLQGQMDAQEVNVSSKVPGRVGELYVKLGQTVPKGQLLFQLTSPEVDAKIAQATAATQAADAVAKKAQAGARPEEVRAAKANWERAQTGANIAKTTYTRVNNMYEQGVIAQQKRDEAQAQWR
ncbi:MAG: biotin/lipoyl-binding protein, partial [Janthinobacterium sp.]